MEDGDAIDVMIEQLGGSGLWFSLQIIYLVVDVVYWLIDLLKYKMEKRDFICWWQEMGGNTETKCCWIR